MSLLTTPWLVAIGWALVHSLWQGALVGLAAWALLKFMARNQASVRCGVALASLGLMALLPVITLFLMAPHGAQALPASPPPETLQARLGPWMPTATLAWSAGVVVMATRLGLGWAWIQRLRWKDTASPGDAWQARLDGLAACLGIKRAVCLLSSSVVRTPMVVGWIRPAVLVPAAAFTGLTPQVLEAVLAHELAHIRRFDYLINLAQNVVETLFFYHPITWWLARQIRMERENACDDLALKLAGVPLPYARALADLEALRDTLADTPQWALAATGGNLMNRIRRILMPPLHPSLAARAGLLATASFLLLGGATLWGFTEEKKPEERRMILQEDGRRVDVRIKGDVKLDPKAEGGVVMGDGASLDLSVRETPTRKRITLKRDAKGTTKTMIQDGVEKPLDPAAEKWLKQYLEELHGLEAKVEKPKDKAARHYRIELDDKGKEGKPRTFIFQTGRGMRPGLHDLNSSIGVYTVDPGGWDVMDLDPLPMPSESELRKKVDKAFKSVRVRTPRYHFFGDADFSDEFDIQKDIHIGGDEEGPMMVITGRQDPAKEAERLRKQIERLQKRLQEVEAKAQKEGKP